MAVFSMILHARACARRTCCNRAETPLKLMFRAHQSRCATRRGRRKAAQNSLREPFGKLVCQSRAKNPFRTLSESSWSVSGAARECFWTAFGHSWPAWGVSDRPWDVIWVSKSRPERVRTRPRNGLGRPKWPKIDFSSIWGRFEMYFGTIFRQFLLEPRATKARKQNLKKESRDP